jgi:predicted amidohydrolase
MVFLEKNLMSRTIVCLSLFMSVPSALARASDREGAVTKVATLTMQSVMGDSKENLARIEGWAVKAQEAGATFAVFPELCVNGALCKSDLSRAEAHALAAASYPVAVRHLEALARRLRMTLVVGLEQPEGDQLGNCALVVGPAGRLTAYRKLRLPNRTEAKWFVPGRQLPVIVSQGWKFSVGICADIDQPDYFVAAASRGAEFMLCPIGGSGFGELVAAGGDQTRQARKHRELHLKLLAAAARDARMYVFYANQAGRSGSNWFPGLALAVDPRGQLVGEHSPAEGMIVTEVSRRAPAAGPRKLASVVRNSAGEPVEIIDISEPGKSK